MIILSSFRPHSRGGSFPRNQIRAHKSWEDVARRIVYFGNPEPDLYGNTTVFIPCFGHPLIKDMAAVASQFSSMVAIVNADIVLSRQVAVAEQKLISGKWRSAVSRRWHFDPETFDLEKAVDDVSDRGRDFFMTHPKEWAKIAAMIPEVYRIGHQMWDAWVCDFFRDNHKRLYQDFTHLRCVFHPRHGEREMPHSKEIEQYQRVANDTVRVETK